MMIKTTTITIMMLLVIATTISIIDGSITGFQTNTQTQNSENNVVIGDVFVQHKSQTELKGIKEFYDNIKKFSEQTITACQNHADKDACVEEQRTKAETLKLKVNNCEGTNYPEPINNSDLKNFELKITKYKEYLDKENLGKKVNLDTLIQIGEITISGIIIDIKEDNSMFTGYKLIEYLTINQSNGVLLNIYFNDVFTSDTPERKEYIKIMTKLSSSKNKYVQIIGNPQEINENKVHLNIGPSTKRTYEHNVLISPDYYSEDALKKGILQISDCAASNNKTCICEVDFNLQGTLNFYENTIKFNELELPVPVKFYTFDVNVLDKINIYSPTAQPTNTNTDYVTAPEFQQPQTQPDNSEEELQEVLNSVEIYNPPVNQIRFARNIEENSKLLFKKDDSMNDMKFIFTDSNKENLPVCEIQKKHYLFCAEAMDWGETSYEKQNPLKMNFALII